MLNGYKFLSDKKDLYYKYDRDLYYVWLGKVEVTQLCPARQAPLFMEFSREEYWSGLQIPPPGDLPNPRIEPVSPALAGGFFTTEPPGKPQSIHLVATKTNK